MQPSFMNNTPPGFVGVAHDGGWMTANSFIKYLEYFIPHDDDSEAAATKEIDIEIETPTPEVNAANLKKKKPEKEAPKGFDIQQPSTSTVISRDEEPPKTPHKEGNLNNRGGASGLSSLLRAEPKARRPRKKFPSLGISSTLLKMLSKAKRLKNLRKNRKA
ncbi:hypothetical protein JTB14_012855 [Gonioctena quinquepunctata]|nr:hypothetical protein JTB14_012855 [Gonioctena quinquepunctata]